MPADGPKRLNWEWEELVLACDLVMQNNGRYVDDRDPRAIELSQVLRQMQLYPHGDRLPTFRNPNGVAQKTRNLVQHLPDYTGSTSSGSKKDREVVERFLADPGGMHELAESIRAAVVAGKPLPSRTQEQAEVGDDLTPDQLMRILARLRVYRRNRIPALDQPITLLWAFSRARRGEPRVVSWPETQRQVKALLNSYCRDGEGDSVFYPIAALHTAGLWELDTEPEQVPSAHGSSVPQRWFDSVQPNGGLVEPVYDMLRESPATLIAAVNTLARNYFTDVDPAMLLSELGLVEPEVASPVEMSFAARVAEYRRRCAKAEADWRERDATRVDRMSSVPIRSADARGAVLLRSEGRCENPCCTGDIQDCTDNGAPILEIDHIHDLAMGGDDDPAQMIALCPNCHATKTRGTKRAELKPILLATAKHRHDRLARPTQEP